MYVRLYVGARSIPADCPQQIFIIASCHSESFGSIRSARPSCALGQTTNIAYYPASPLRCKPRASRRCEFTMRLLNTSTGVFEEFIGTNIPAYAILSHTWGDEEVSFKDMTTKPTNRSKKGYTKISMTCRLAQADELQYACIDTCCIDKSSSAELSEAINSMYRWYQSAEKCYAYLADLESTTQWRQNLPRCRWFTRGWTLQELIAPEEVYFFDEDWNRVFRKSDKIDILALITGVDKNVLRGSRSVLSVSVAQRMSWAS